MLVGSRQLLLPPAEGAVGVLAGMCACTFPAADWELHMPSCLLPL
jgi:hypothetical protein